MKSSITQKPCIPGTWRGPRKASTLLAQMADLERGQRIKELRESRHLTQEAMADKLGVTLRGYQEWEAGGGIKWENVKKLAKQHGVEADFLMNGPKPETPDLLGASQLDRIEKIVTGLADSVGSIEAQLALLVAAQEPQPKRGGGSGRSRASGN